MPISFNCPSCGAGLSVKEEFAGKNANCPQCGKAFVVPTPAPQPAQPTVPQIKQPAAAPAQLPQIQTGPPQRSAPAPNINVGPKPGAAPHPGPAPAQPSPYAAPGFDHRSDMGSGGEPARRKYPALQLAATLYQVMAMLVLILGSIGVIVVLGAGLWGMSQSFSILGLLMILGYVAIMALYIFLMWITLTAASEFIKLALNVEHDSHRTADAVRDLTRVLSQK